MTGLAVYSYFEDCENSNVILVPKIPDYFDMKVLRLASDIVRDTTKSAIFWDEKKDKFTYGGDPSKRAETMVLLLNTYWKVKELL